MILLRSNPAKRYDSVSIIFYFRQGRKKDIARDRSLWLQVACIASCVCCVPTRKIRVAKGNDWTSAPSAVSFLFYFVKWGPLQTNMRNSKGIGEQGWGTGKSTRLQSMWPGFKSLGRRHRWVEFVVYSPLLQEVFLRCPGFSLFS